MEEQYQITLNKEQLFLLKEITDKFARLIIGQLDNSVGEVMRAAVLRHITKGEINDVYMDLSNQINVELNLLHKLCWDQKPNEFFGVKYSEKSDTLFDMYEVIRYFLYQEDEDNLSILGSNKPFHWNEKQPLIKIEKL